MDDRINEFLDDPIFALSEQEQQLFELTEPMKKASIDKAQADFIAQRRPCTNFEEYEAGFKRVHQELKEGKRRLVRYSIQTIEEGHYYVIGGVLVYLAKIFNIIKSPTKAGIDGRTLTIYENGMESNIMLQTLSKSAYLDGYTVSEPDEAVNNELRTNMGLTPEDTHTGWIYVLSSKSKDPQIASIKDLYKIGFTTTPVEERLKNCEKEPTYLMNKVKVERTWKTYNLNTLKLETLIHQFFSDVQLQVRVKDQDGVMHKTDEWYIVPLAIIEQVIDGIMDGSIIGCCYNKELQCIEQVDEKGHRIQQGTFDKTGWKILPLNVYREYFDAIYKGEKSIEYRQLKPTVEANMKRFTWVDNTDGKRYLRKYDGIRFTCKDATKDKMLVEVVDTTFDNEHNIVQFHLGKILEVDFKAKKLLSIGE